MPQRVISEDYFSDPFITNTESLGKLLFLYLICNHHNKISGFYQIEDRVMSLQTGIPLTKVKSLLKHFQAEGKIFYDGGFIFIKNMARHQNCSKLVNAIKQINKSAVSNKNQIKNRAYQAFLREMRDLKLLNKENEIFIVEEESTEGLGNPYVRVTKQQTINNELLTINNELRGESEGGGFNLSDNPLSNGSNPESVSISPADSGTSASGKKHEIQLFIAANCPSVAKMAKPITFNQCEKIVETYGNNMSAVYAVLEQMENNTALRRKYKSTFLTLKTWVENHLRWSEKDNAKKIIFTTPQKELKEFERKALEQKSKIY